MTSTEQLERETEQTRVRLAETLDELRSMTPGRVVDEVLDYAKAGGGDFLRNVGSKLGTQISENPVPAMLIGAGIVWLVMSDGKARLGEDYEAAIRGDGDGRGLSYGEGRDLADKAGSPVRSLKDGAQSASAGLSSIASSVSEKASGAMEAVSNTA